jgi:hypothetical protein
MRRGGSVATLVAAGWLGLAPILIAPGVAAASEQFGIGGISGPAVPSCPGSPCLAITETTGFQASIGGHHLTMVVGSAGRVTSWSIALSTPTAAEVTYFDGAAHGAPRAGLVVLRHTTGYHFRVVAASPVVALTPYLGRTTKFNLARPLAVRSGDILALSVPTWAPALASGLAADTAWRASRPTGTCNSVFAETAVTGVGAVANSECVYPTARLAYGATLAG